SCGSGTSSAGFAVPFVPARISSSKTLLCVSSGWLSTPNGLARDSPLRRRCSGSYCVGYGLDGKNLSSWSRPETVLGWHRAGFRLYWKWLSRARSREGRKPVSKEIRALIFQMVAENPTWGAPRIHGELLKLGFDLWETTVSRFLPPPTPPPARRRI